MKRTLFWLFLPLIMWSCGKISPVVKIAQSAPIIPIRMSSDTVSIYLTDYMPTLFADSAKPTKAQVLVSENIDIVYRPISESLPDMICIADTKHTIGHLTIHNKWGGFTVVILPNKPVRQAMVTEAMDGDMLCIRFLDSVAAPRIEALIQNIPVQDDLWEHQTDGTWTLPLNKIRFPIGRTFLRIFAESDNYLYNDILIPMENGIPVTNTDQLTRYDDQAKVLYSVLIDRFENGNKNNDWKLNSPEVLDIVDYHGGDIAGITKRITSGYFDSIGINTLWISPITQNPLDAWGYYHFENGNKYDSTKTYTKYSGYHGYWPIYATAIDHRFGTGAELKVLLDTAHAHNINVILDYVANHMHINSPTLKEHPTWHTDSLLPDGRRNFELWDEARLTTWFDKHIPTLDLERADVCGPMTDSALYWIQNYDLDGYRHDACKHIPEGYWRMLVQKMSTRYPDRHLWMIGETYGSPELIGTYVKSGMLNAQFDFNVYFSATHALCNDGSMADINNTILQSLAAYGSHHTMGNISGNHDQVRFASFAGGAVRFDEDPKEAGWTRVCGLLPNNVDSALRDSLSQIAYRRALLLEVLNLTLPGVPCIYQGDEYAEVGAGDPDNRHPMRFDNLNQNEKLFRNRVSQLIHYRRHSLPLIYGEYIPVESTDSTLTFDRMYMGETIRVYINRNTCDYSITDLKLNTILIQ